MQTKIAKLIGSLTIPLGQSSDFDLSPDTQRLSDDNLRQAAVLVVLWDRPQGTVLILTKRASHLKHHPGQIAFPGGKVDDADQGLVATALREAQEEIGLPQSHVQILGQMPLHETVTGFSITPVLGLVMQDFFPTPQPDEVEEIFTVPMSHIFQTVNYRVEERMWGGHIRRYYTVPYGPYYIWGATARILRGMAERVSL